MFDIDNSYAQLPQNSRAPTRISFEEAQDEVMGTGMPFGLLLLAHGDNLNTNKAEFSEVQAARRAWLADANSRAQARMDMAAQAAAGIRLQKRLTDTQAQLSVAEARAKRSPSAQAWGHVQTLRARLNDLKRGA